MKIKSNVIMLWLTAAMMLVSLVACDTRPIPGDLILTTYNSDMESTKRFAPMDTLYVKIAGMRANKFYRIRAIDAEDNLISMIEARTNDEGVIDPIPLWYNVGLQGNDSGMPYINMTGGLTVSSFYVNVKSIYDGGDSTDFTQTMFIVYSGDTENDKPIVYSCYTPDGGTNYYPENAFKETGTLLADGSDDPKTVVYVKADRVPTQIGEYTIAAVDFYVMAFTGDAFSDGDVLDGSDTMVLKLTNQAVVDGVVDPVALWDLNGATTLVNPGEDNMAYSIVMDVDRDGVYDAGIDTNSDGLSDYYIDGVDGNGEPGFIVQNTPANDLFVTISDENGNIVNSIPETGATADQYLNISINNLPVASGASVTIYLVDSFDGTNGAIPADVRSGGEDSVTVSTPTPSATELRYLPYIEDQDLVDTSNAGDYDYPTDVSADTPLDLIIDMDENGVYNSAVDYFIDDAVTILFVAPDPDYATCTDNTGATETHYFDESNTEDGNTEVFLKGTDAPDSFDVYVLKNSKFQTLTLGTSVLSWVSEFSVADLVGGTGDTYHEIWDLDGSYKVINPGIGENTFNLVMDNDGDGIYDADDDVLTVVILNTNANSYPRLTYVNIASGGSFGNTYAQHWTLYSQYCDYRDVFIKSGLDTNPNGGYGVKAVFNPYFSWFYNPDPETPVAGLYYGLYVDVYIVNADPDSTDYFDLSDYGHAGELNDDVDVTGRHSTLVVQPSCYNGAGMMTIWPAQMTPGKYYVIVDVNRNGRIDEGTDIIDAVTQDGDTIIDDATVVGFSVE